ncbi:hypothetical protein J2Z31_001202 [Sinorhizobium kostiense]|uniref:Uncharacterized protein n=1 Tax=Sinorhizobium kostiense TaxID=76747 RepID=A0ABS4QVP1_9HYPH|nr:hypothetical protein [Sinorhizobium kostiense]MBP2234712.1 hypothetical protein [Sinorhizobium kostiense]
MTKLVLTAICEHSGDRQRECERALNDEFDALTRAAEGAGWSWEEIALALMELVEQYVVATGTHNVAPAPITPSKSKTLH